MWPNRRKLRIWSHLLRKSLLQKLYFLYLFHHQVFQYTHYIQIFPDLCISCQDALIHPSTILLLLYWKTVFSEHAFWKLYPQLVFTCQIVKHFSFFLGIFGKYISVQLTLLWNGCFELKAFWSWNCCDGILLKFWEEEDHDGGGIVTVDSEESSCFLDFLLFLYCQALMEAFLKAPDIFWGKYTFYIY